MNGRKGTDATHFWHGCERTEQSRRLVRKLDGVHCRQLLSKGVCSLGKEADTTHHTHTHTHTHTHNPCLPASKSVSFLSFSLFDFLGQPCSHQFTGIGYDTSCSDTKHGEECEVTCKREEGFYGSISRMCNFGRFDSNAGPSCKGTDRRPPVATPMVPPPYIPSPFHLSISWPAASHRRHGLWKMFPFLSV